MFKDKIIAAIKAKYPKVNLSKARLDAIAAKIEPSVIDDETKIDAALTDFNEFTPLTEIARYDDFERSRKAKEAGKKETDPKKEDPKKEEVDPVIEIDPETPAWAKVILESNKKLTEKLATFEKEKTQTSMKSKAALLLKDIPEVIWGKRALPETEEGLEAFVADVTADFATFNQDRINNGLGAVEIPKAAAGGAAGGDDKKATKEEIDNVVNNIT